MSLRRSQAPGKSAIDAALVAACAVGVHARSIGFGLVGLDDRDLVVDDAAFLSRPAALWEAFGRAYMGAVDAGHAYYRPLVTASLALDAHWGGTGFASYHATNVALHAAASVGLWMLLRRLYVGRVAAWISAAAFAVHPALTPAVAWIPGRNDSLLALLCVSSWLAFLARRRVVHLVLFACALLTKETAIALPLVCGVHALLLEPPLAGARLAAHAAGWLGLIGARLAVWPPSSGSVSLALEPARWLRSLLGGLGELALPLRPIAIAVAQDVPVVPGVAALLGIALATVALRSVRRRVVALGVAAFFLWLLPPVLATGSLVLGQRLYLPAVGGAVVLAEVLRAAAPDPPNPQARVVAAWGGVALAALAAVTVAFQGTFRDRRSFAREAVDASPHCALAHVCQGQSLQTDGDEDRALAEYRTALSLGAVEVVHNNIAVILMKRALWPEAASELEQEIASNPGYARAHLNLAVVLRHEGNREDACRSATRGSELSGDPGIGLEIETERARDCDH